MLTISKCENIVQSYFSSVLRHYQHFHGRQLTMNNNKYMIQPDETYITKSEVIIVEYEKNKRPVESISKFWWLLKKTNWISEGVIIKMLLIGLNPVHKGIRSDSIEILGHELEKQFPDQFKFFYIPHDKVTTEEIMQNLKLIAC